MKIRHLCLFFINGIIILENKNSEMILGSNVMEENVYELLKSFNLCNSSFNKINYRTGIYNANPEY